MTIFRPVSRKRSQIVSVGACHFESYSIPGKRRLFTVHRWEDVNYLRKFLLSVKERYGINDTEWHLLSNNQIKDIGGAGLLRRYDTLQKSLKVAFPELQVQPKKRQPWKNLEYLQQFLRQLQLKYSIKDNEWHLITNRQVIDLGGGGLIVRYKTLHEAVKTAFPESESKPKEKSRDWCSIEFVRSYLKQVQEHYNISDNEWHLVTKKQIIDFKGDGLFNRYTKLSVAIKEAFPDIVFKARKQNWRDKECVRDYLNRVKAHYKINDDEWHLVTNKQIADFNGRGLLKRYKTLREALRVANPDIVIKSKTDWTIQENVFNLLENIKKEHDLTQQDLRSLSKDTLKQYGADQALGYFKSKSKLFAAAYPAEPFRNPNKPQYYFDDSTNIIQFMKQMEKKLYIKQPEDWYRVSAALLERFGSGGLIRKRKFVDVLRMCYPDFQWNEKLVQLKNKKSEQFFLRNVVQEIFPNTEVIEDYLHSGLTFSSGAPMELDLYLPEKSIAFEYQGEHHFEDSPYFGPLEMYQQRDKEKLSKCAEIGIRLVIVPHWWARTEDDLRNRVNQYEKINSTL